jgi:hypothetical protein
MDFLNHRKGGMVFCQVFFLVSILQFTELNCRNRKRLREFEGIESQGNPFFFIRGFCCGSEH